MKIKKIFICGVPAAKTGMLCACGLLISAAVMGQDIQSGMWFADGRSMGMGGALMGGGNNCFDVKNIDTEEDFRQNTEEDFRQNTEEDFWQNTEGDSRQNTDGLLQEQDSVMGYVPKADTDKMPKTDTGKMLKTDTGKMPKTHINKVSQTTCRAYVNGVLPYGMNDLAVLSAGAVVDWKQYSWWLHGGWSGKDEQFVSLLFGHTVGQKWRYVVGVAMYRLDMSLKTADGMNPKTADGMPHETVDEAGGTGVSWAVLAFMAEAGVFYRPLESLQIGVWMGNPTLTHKDSLYFATDFHLGAVYDVSERLQFVLELEKQLQHSLFAHFGMEMAIWHPSSNKWRVDGRAGVRYPYTEVSAGLGVAHLGKTKLHFDAAAVCDWKLGWSFATSVGVGF